MPRKEHRSTAKLCGDVLYSEIEGFRIGGPQWALWLAEHTTFYYESLVGSFTARREQRRNGLFWYAYRRHAGKLYKVYLGRPADLTVQTLTAAAVTLSDRVSKNM